MGLEQERFFSLMMGGAAEMEGLQLGGGAAPLVKKMGLGLGFLYFF